MHKLMLTTALVGLAAAPHAAGLDGAYLGAQLGYNSTNVEYNETDHATYDLTIDGLSASGGEYGVFAGYGKVMPSNLYLGAEVEYNKSSAKNTITASGLGVAGDVETKKKSSYGAAVRAGYVMGNVMPYARVGYNRAEFEQEITGLGSADANESGIAFGAGVEFTPTDTIGIRGEFVRTSYGKISGTYGGSDATFKPEENVARVGISYRF